MTREKNLNTNLDIHKPKEHVIIAHFAIVSNTYISIALPKIVGKCSFTNCLQDGKTHLQSQCIIKQRKEGFSTIDEYMYPFPTIKTKSLNYYLVGFMRTKKGHAS
jgi:hypothetical protein